MAAALVSSVPVIILFLVGQKYFVSGLSTGSVKG
jgi:multiple sugar transport system permease protein